MNTSANATFTTASWDEKPYIEVDEGQKLTRTHATFTYEGALEGEGTVEYLMAYCPNGLGNFVGLERIEGKLGGRQGSFVVQHTGTFDPKSVTTCWEIVPGSGTGELKGLSGRSTFVLEGHGPYPVMIDYSIG
ncbi:MAG: DUF3224 domain-containing protein [Chloroflexota bacterium]